MANFPLEDDLLPNRQGPEEGSEPFSDKTFLENIGPEPGEDEAEAARLGMADVRDRLGADGEAGIDPGETDFPPTGGGLSSLPDQAEVVGDEAIGGTVAVPDQDVVDEIAASVGVEVRDQHPLNMVDKMDGRDERRWELDPDSEGRPSDL